MSIRSGFAQSNSDQPAADSEGTEGFTLIELVVAMTLTMLVAGFTFSVYLFASRVVGRWRAEVELENTLHTVLDRVAIDLYATEQLSTIARSAEGTVGVPLSLDGGESLGSGPGWELDRGEGNPPVTYRLIDSTLYRNGHPMHGREVAVMRVQFTSDSLLNRSVSGAVGIRTAEPNGPLVHVALSLTLRGAGHRREQPRVLSAATSMVLRRPLHWRELAQPSVSR